MLLNSSNAILMLSWIRSSPEFALRLNSLSSEFASSIAILRTIPSIPVDSLGDSHDESLISQNSLLSIRIVVFSNSLDLS